MNEDDGRVVFIPQLNTFGTKFNYEFDCNDWDAFYTSFDLEGLNKLLEHQLEIENYEAAEVIKKYISKLKS